MSKRNINYVKPRDPSFLVKLKAEIGYKEAPSIEAKRQRPDEDAEEQLGRSNPTLEDDTDRPEREDEQPQVVVLAAGDLSAEQVAQEKLRIAKEQAEAPADLNQRVIFRQKAKADKSNDSQGSPDIKSPKSKTKKKTERSKSTNKLSFNDEDEEEDE